MDEHLAADYQPASPPQTPPSPPQPPNEPQVSPSYHTIDDRIFPLTVGGKTRYLDPLAIWRRFTLVMGGENLDEKLNSFESTIPAASLPASEILANASRAGFELQPIDPETGEGVSDNKAIKILYEFLAWQDDVKKNSDTRANLSAFTGIPPDID